VIPQRPIPCRKRVVEVEAVEEETVLDEVIQKIDESLPAIHRMVAVRKKQSRRRTATDRLAPEEARRAQAAFQEMKDNPLLTDSGDDIRESPLQKINGASPKSEDQV
jgi:hypothetical protein